MGTKDDNRDSKNKFQMNQSRNILRVSMKVFLKVALFFIVVGILVAAFTTATGAGYFASLIKDEPIKSNEEMKRDIYNYEETSKIYFADNKYIGDISAPLQREEIALDKISPILIDAVLATEDQKFYEHNGIVPKAIARAIFQEVSGADVQTGGSTLTQQLIKNQMLSNEVSFDRKAKEILLAIHLENNFEKDEILGAYLNIIPYGREASGRNIAGILKASQGVFGLNPDEVNIAQAAYLAGLPQNPYTYTPFTNKGELKDEEGLAPGFDRMKVVLKRMYTAEVITKEEYDEAINYDIQKDFTEKKASPTEKYPVLVFEIEKRAKKILMKEKANEDGYSSSDLEDDEELKEEYADLADHALRMNGYEIHTTIDKDLYESMQKVAKDYEYYGPDRTFTEQDPNTGESKSVTQPIQAGAVLIENNSGKIISFVGNREATVNDHFNYAMNAKRQPGSTFKPLAVFAPGMDLGILQPGTVIPDIPDGNANSPSNYGNGYYGLVSAREALTKSHNVSTTNAYKMIKDENPAKNYLRKMNLDLTKEHETIDSLALGTNDVSVEQNTSAFSTLGNEGKYADSYMIDKITTNDGDEVYEHELDPVDVFSPQAAYLTIDMMRDVLTQGTGTFVPAQLSNSGVDWAGKTGTSQDYRDAWFIGMNPNVTLGTWIGYETQASIWCDNCTYSYSQRNQKLWANLINKATEVNPELMAPKEQFKEPENIVTRNYCAISGLAPSKLCSDAGLVTSDIYDSKYVPSKKDDSLVGQSGKAKLVLVKDKEVVAGDKTPSEFTFSGKSSGYAFNPEFLKANGYDKLGDLSVLFPRTNRDAWEKISVSGSKNVASSSIKDDGKPPAKPGDIKANGEKISWGASSGNVVGYRIYKGSNKIDSTTSTSFTLPQGDGKYSVKAVDYFGRESSASNEIKVSVKKDDKKDKDKDQKKDDKKEEKDKDKDKKEKDKKEKEDKDKKEKDEKEKEDKDKKEKDEKEKKEKEKKEKEKKDKEKEKKEDKN